MPEQLTRAKMPIGGFPGPSNASHFLHFGLQPLEGRLDSEAIATHLNRVCGVRASAIYAEYFKRREAALTDIDAKCGKLECDGRLFIGLSSASLFETSISMDPTYGVPVIHGEACKGLARRAGKSLLSNALFKAMFGTADKDHGVGMVRFHDALWVPDSAPAAYTSVLKWVHRASMIELYGPGVLDQIEGTAYPFVREIVNPHHPDFAKSGHKATVFDDPIPVPMIAAHGKFLFAVQGVRLWRDHAWALLEAGLLDEGIGARTPEYGRFKAP